MDEVKKDMTKDDNLTTKKFKGFMVLDWKNESIRVRKTRPDSVSPFEIPIKLEIDVVVPKRKELHAKAEIVLNKEKVNQMVISQI